MDRSILVSHLDEFLGILRQDPDEYWEKEHLLLELSGKFDVSVVAIVNNRIAGFIIASCKTESVHIHKFMVNGLYRKKGIGTRLLQYFESGARSQNRPGITLNVYESNSGAIRFYSNLGFVTCGKRADTKNDNILLTMSKLI